MKTLYPLELPSVDFEHIQKGIVENLEALRNSKMLITGASGFIGLWMMETLIWLNIKQKLNIDIYVVVRNSISFKKIITSWSQSQIKIIEGDLSTMIIQPDNYKYIIHLASEPIKNNDNGTFFHHMSKSVAAANNLISLAKICETESILFTSSGAVYGDYLGLHSTTRPFKENIQSIEHIFNEKAIYAETKRYIELLFSTASSNYNFKIKIARCFSFVGPLLPLTGNYAIGNFIYDVLNGHDLVIKGDGRPLRSYLYISDLIKFLLLILLEGRANIPYNVGSPQTVSIAEVAKMINNLSGSKSRLCIANIEKIVGAGDAYIPDLRNIKNDFNLNNIINLEDAIIRTLEWYKRSHVFK